MRKFILSLYQENKRLYQICFFIGLLCGLIGGGFVAYKILSNTQAVHPPK